MRVKQTARKSTGGCAPRAELKKLAARKRKNYENFYEPSEDTFILLDALEEDIQFINDLNPLMVLEIGCGAGLGINYLAKNLKNAKKTLFFATDLNKNAIEAAVQTSQTEKTHNLVNLINCGLTLPFIDRLDNSFDILLFNLSYALTEANELVSNAPAKAIGKYLVAKVDWKDETDKEGFKDESSSPSSSPSSSLSIKSVNLKGKTSREVMDHIFPLVDRLLSKDGVFYLVCSESIRFGDIKMIKEIEKLETKFGFTMSTLLEEDSGVECLFALKFVREKKSD